jgi:hypothetical protein
LSAGLQSWDGGRGIGKSGRSDACGAEEIDWGLEYTLTLEDISTHRENTNTNEVDDDVKVDGSNTQEEQEKRGNS